MYAELKSEHGDQVTSHASYPPENEMDYEQARRMAQPMASSSTAKETSTSDAFTYLENELEELHNTVEILYDALRNILREPIPCGDDSVDPRPGISDIQRALWNQGEKVRSERHALQMIIRRIDI